MPNDKTQKNLSSLHNTLETMGYEVPNIDQFTKYMRKEKNLRTVYDAIASDGGYELPDFETFKANMGWIKPTPAGVPTPLRPKDQLAPTGKPDAPATPFGFDLSANPKKPSHAPKARLGFPRLDKKMRPVQEVNDPSVPLLKTTRDVAQDEDGNVVNVVQPELVPDFDPNNGGVTAPKALMDVTTGKTIRPTELSKEEVDGYNAGNIDAVKDPKLRQALKEANIVYAPDVDMDKVHREQVRDLEQEIDADLKTAYDSFTDKVAAKAKDTRNLMRFGLATAGASMGGGATTMGMHANPLAVESDPEIYMLRLAKHNIQDAKNYIAEADHNAQEGTFSKWLESSFAGGAARGFAQKLFDARTWDMGIGDAGEAASIKAAVNKADLGEKLTPAEDKLLQSMVTKMAVEAYFNSQVGRGYTAGSVSAYSIPFMLEMAANPVSTSGNAIGAKLMRYAVRKFGLNVAGKALRKKAVKAAVKYGVGGLTSAAVSSAALTATSGTAHVAADAVSRNTGDLKFDYKADPETGELRAKYSGHEEGDDALTATGKAFFMRFMENFSEYSGEALAPIAAGVAKGVGAGAKAAGKAIASRMGKAGAKILDAGRWGTKAARELIDNISASEFGRTITALEKKAHYNGKVLEFAEEKISDLASVLIGDKDLSTDKGKGFFNLDDNIDTFLGVSLTGGVISAAQTAGYFAGGGARGMARYQIGQSEGAVWSTLTTDEQRKAWDDVRRQILLQDGKEQVDAVKSALTNPNFNAEQRRAILDYTKSVQTYKGMSEYRRKQSEDTKADPLQNELADSYDKGAGMTEAEEMSHARSWYEFAQQKAAERLGVDAEALDEMGAPEELTLDQVAQLREEHNKQAVQSYVDYLNARATYEGMIGSVSQGIQAEAAQAEQAVRSQQHKDGALRRATLRGTEGQNVEVHIKDGDLVMDEEGRIDTDKSSKDFIVRDNETGVVRFASIDDIISAEQPTSADDAVSEAVNAVYERREKEAADAINGTITPQVGAVYNLLDADGNPQQIAIRQVGQDGTLDVDYSGVPHKMTTDELQTMADNTRARQIENEHAVQVQQAKAEEREEREQAGLPRYALNDELTIRTPEGDEVTAYVTNEEDADGNIEVYFNEPFDGKKVHLFTKDYLDGVVVGTRLSPETNTSAGAVEAPATAAAPALAQVQSVSEEVPEEATTAPTPTQEEENDIIGRSMTEEEAEAFLTAISNNHEVAPELELTPENWYAEFGEDGVVHTPIGDAHMGENQFLKMMRDGRKSKLGMIRPTLEAPHAIVEEPSTAKEGQETERDSSYIYIRVFEKEDGSRHYHFTSVSVQRDGGEVIVSNQEKSRNQVKRLLTEGVVLWMRADNAPDTSDVDQDLYSSQGTELSDPASEGTDASQSTPSESKDNESASHADPNDESLSPEEAYEAVLRAANGDAALALEVIKSTITDKEKALTKAKKAKPRSANTIDGKIQALAEVASGIEAAETSLAHWQAVAEIAAEQVQEEVAEVAEPVAEQTEQESEEPTTEQAPAEEETTEEQEEGVTTETEEAAPEAGDTQASDATGEGYRLSTIAAKRGGNFFENNEGSIDLVKISDNVFEAIGIKPLPMRMTEAMAQHIIKQHAKELGISTQEEAVAFVVDIMQHFDHVREGNKPNTYIFSIEKGRSRTGKRAVTLVLPSKSGEYLGVSSSGYEKVSRLKERALLWEEGANNEAPTTETASANVTSPSATQGGMTGGSASNQSNALSQGKDSEKEIAEGEANDGNQDDLSIEEKEALLSKAKQELEEKENERTAVAEQAIAIMKDYYDSGAIPGMDSGEFHGQATLILIGFKDRSNLELMKAPGLSELLPSLYKLADEARAKKVLVRKYEKELSQAKEVEGETLTHDKAIRDELVNTMRDAGIEVITDEAEGQAVLDAVHAGEAQMQRAYHGTDADFEAFDHSHMGEGAGGQAYGWGSYFTEEEGVARSYAGGGFVYEAELPDDTGSNYLHFESKPSNKDIARVKRELVEYILRNDEEGMYDYPQGKDDLTQEVDDAGEPTTWRDLYGTVSSHLGSDKEASAFFHSIGYVGIQYNSSETDGGKKNLVIFDESDISIQSKVRLFKTSSGEVYGFVKDGKIYLDLKHATAETAIHEYTHLWASALRRVNPRAWKSIRKQLKGFEMWADIASRYPELKGDEDALADEVLAQYSGKRGAQRIEEEMKKAENATDLVGKARVLAAFNSLKEALKTFWTEVADFFGMDYYKSVEDAADKAMSDLLRGVNPNAVEAKKETTKKKPTKKATAKKETATSSVIAPDSERYNGYIVTLPKSGKAGAEVGDMEEFVGADEMREGLMVVYQAPEGFAVASNGTMAIADKTQFDVYKKGKAYKLDGTTIDAGAWKPLKDQWQSFVSTETRGEHSDPFTESPVNITRLSKYLDRVEQDLYNRWKYAKSEGLTKDSFKTYRSRALVVIPNGRGGYVEYRYPEMRSMTLAAKRLGVTSFFVEGDHHYESSVYPGVRLVGNGRLGSVVHAGYIFRHDAPKPSESELSYLYDEAVGVKDTDEGVRMQKGDEGLSLQETSDAINARFNEELKEQLEGALPQDHIYTLGLPGKILRSTGIPNLPIEMSASRANLKSNQENHPFSLEVLEDLPKMLQHPIAVFSYGDKRKAQNVIVEVEHQGQNLLVGLSLNQEKDGIEVNSIRGLFPKYTHGWLLWIQQGKALYLNKEAIQDKIEQWRTNLANVPYLNLDSITKVVETFDNPPLASEDLEISNDNQASEDNDKEVRYRSDEEVEQDDLDMQDLEEVATSMAEVLGEDVRVIHDTAEIEGRNESETNRMRGAKGWYDPKTGQVVVVLPNAESADDVEATILHEVVGHKGLQELVGKDQFGKFLDEVFEGANEAVRNGIVERSKRYGWNTRLATEEYIAELAEQGFKDLEARDLWNVVRNAFYNLLSRVKLALGWDISDRELRYMLWRTYQMKKGEGLMGKAKDIAMQEKLGVGNYEDARFRQGEIAPVKVAATYDALIRKSSYQTQEALQDSMLSLKKVMEMIMQAKGDAKYIEEIEGYQNAYMGENRVSSVNQAEAAAYSRMALEPLVEEVSRLAKKAHHSYVTDYMMAKHGLERNRVMAFQKAVEADVDAHNKAVKESGEGEELTASSLWDAYLNDTDRLRNEADYRNGNITADVWHKTDDEIRARYAPSYAEYRERDYAGLTGLLDRADEDIQTIEAEAIEEVMKFEQENDVTDLWDLTNKATDAPLSKQYEGGLMSRETLEHVRNMYGYYIPLRGFDETTSDEAYSYLGDRDRAFSPTLKKAKGRSSKAEDPLAHIASMMESAILQSNRNKLVRQKFLNFVENNPSDLFSVQKLWVKWNEVTKAWEAVLPEFDPNDTSEEVIRKTQEFEEMMRENKRKDPKNFKLASEQPSIPYRVVSLGEQMQHQIVVKRGGRDVVIIVNGDPRVAMAVNGQTNPDGEAKGHIGALFRAGAAVNRKLAGFYTSLSPNFVVKNFIRDIIYANTIAWVKESPTYAMTYHANVAKLAGQMHRLVHLYEHDKLDMSNETHRAFKLFMENGGETGYSQLRSMDRHKKEIERMMKESGGRISPKQAFRLLGDTMEFANRGIEDLSRFAAFLTSRQMGRTIDRSIYDAKEMTVNFNKKGAGSTFYDATTQSRVGNAAALLSGTGRSLYLFWNVSIQGSVNIARAVKRNPKKGTAYLATFLALGILQTMLPALTGGDDDDRYWNLPDYVRRNNICFFVGDVLVKIPLPQEARAIFGIGELGMSYSSRKEDKTPMELAQTIAGQISQVMPLDLMDDSGATHALMPSLAKPFFEAQTNHSWMGRPIWKDTDYNKAMPDWTKAYKATGGAYVWLAKELNAITGGDDYKQGWVNINPAKLEYMLKGYLGGLYTAADQIIKSSETAFGDREFSMRDVPILSGFLDGADERNDMRNVNNTYYHFKEEAKEVLRLGKSYESDLDQGKSDSTDYAKKLDELVNDKSYERALLFEDLSKEIEEMQKALKEATDPKEAEELQAEIDKQKKALVIQLRQMK